MTTLKFSIKDERGSALILTIVVVGILTMLSAAFANLVTQEYRNAVWQKKWVQAFYLAEAGLNKGIALVREDWLDKREDGMVSDLPKKSLGDGYDGTYLVCFASAEKAIYIKSTGEITGVIPGKPINRVIKIQMLLNKIHLAAFGVDTLKIGGGAEIYGNIGSNGDIVPAGSYTVTGEKLKNAGVSLPPLNIVIPPELPHLNIKDFSDGGKPHPKYTLTGGTYYFPQIAIKPLEELVINGNVTIYCDSFSSKGQVTITTNSKLTIYCTGDFEASGNGIINTDRKPENFTLYCTGSDVKLTGGSEFYGVAFAPKADMFTGGGCTYYGSLIGKTMDATGGAEIHYDEAIKDVINARTVTTVSWH